MPRGCRQAYCVERLIRSPTPKLTSSPTLCSTRKSKIKWYSENNHFKDMNRIDGMPTEFEWKIFPGITTLGLLEKIQSLMRDVQCEPEHFTDRIIFMSLHKVIEWKAKCNEEQCEYNSQTVANYARNFPRGHWSFLGLGSEEKWYGTYTDKPDGWDRMGEEMMLNFSGSGHPMFRSSIAFERGELRSKEGGKKSIHFNGSHENIELLLRTVISAQYLRSNGNLQHLIIGKRWKFLLAHLFQKLIPMHSNGETWCKNTSENSSNCQKTRIRLPRHK